MINFLDAFSGIGGFALGLIRAGVKFNKHFYSETDDYCQKLYKLKFPDAIPLGDINHIDYSILQREKKNWVVTGGFPCQDLSSFKKKRKGLDGEKSGLWIELEKSIRILRPRIAIIENVPNLINNGLVRILSFFAKIGYNVQWGTIQAQEFGYPHKRERLFIVAYSHKIRCISPMVSALDKKQSFKEEKKEWENLRQASEIDLCSSNTWKKLEGNCTDLRANNGVPNFMDRIRALGNSIIPDIAESIMRQSFENGVIK